MDPHGILTTLFLLSVSTTSSVYGNGFLKDPPSRSSMWRYGFNTPVNFNHTSLNCGGKERQWNVNGGMCGMCGDPWNGPRENEAGGLYATGSIARTYEQGQSISVLVEITASKRGYFEFRLCPNNEANKIAECECFNKYLLHQSDGETKFYETRKRVYNISLVLPPEVSCSHCVVQWKWNVGNSWGCNPDNHCCTGCGPQEQFYGCADIAIHALPVTDPTSFTPNTTILNNDYNTTTEQYNDKNKEMSMLSCTRYSTEKPMSKASSDNRFYLLFFNLMFCMSVATINSFIC